MNKSEIACMTIGYVGVFLMGYWGRTDKPEDSAIPCFFIACIIAIGSLVLAGIITT